MAEPVITINGVTLNDGQAMTVRVALSSFWGELQPASCLGDDEHAKRMARAYQDRLNELFAIIFGGRQWMTN